MGPFVMAVTVVPYEAFDTFVLCLIKSVDGADAEDIRDFVEHLELSVRALSGKVQLVSVDSREWLVFDGEEHLVAPDHLSEAYFGFDCLLVCAFGSIDAVHRWWSSDEVFEVLKHRSAIEKLGIHAIDGNLPGFDVTNLEKFNYGDKFMLLELMGMQNFKPMHAYLSEFKRFVDQSQAAKKKTESKLVFADSVLAALMNEIPLDLTLGTFWRLRDDAIAFHNQEAYQQRLKPLRQEFSRSVVMLVPIFEVRRLHASKSGQKALNR